MPNMFGAMGGALKKGLQAPGKALGMMPGAKPMMGAMPGMGAVGGAMGMGPGKQRPQPLQAQPQQGIGPSQPAMQNMAQIGGQFGIPRQSPIQDLQAPQPMPSYNAQGPSGGNMFNAPDVGAGGNMFDAPMGPEMFNQNAMQGAQDMQPDQQPMMQRKKAMMGMNQQGGAFGMNRGRGTMGPPRGGMPMRRGIGPSPQMQPQMPMQQDEQM